MEQPRPGADRPHDTKPSDVDAAYGLIVLQRVCMHAVPVCARINST